MNPIIEIVQDTLFYPLQSISQFNSYLSNCNKKINTYAPPKMKMGQGYELLFLSTMNKQNKMG